MQQLRPSQPSRLRRRQTHERQFTPGALTTAVSIGVVLVLLAATFIADWLHTPQVTLASSSSTLLSPNGDRDHDTATIAYTLGEEAGVTVQVFAEGGGLVRILTDGETQTAGQYFAVWDGRDQLGQTIADGSYRLQVIAKGSVRAASQSLALLVDTQPPPLQLVNLPNGQRVGDPSLTIQGLTDAEAIVWVNGDPQPLTVDAQGRFTLQRRLNEGINRFEVRAVDQAGNANRLTREITLVTAPPDVIIFSPLEDSWLNTPLVTVSGQAPLGASLSLNDRPVPVAEDGSFRHELLLDEGQNLLRFTATDDVGNSTTVERWVHLKTTAPTLALNVSEGATIAEPTLQLVGRTDPGATVLLNRKVIPVSALGDFQTTIDLFEGDNTIEVEARDQAGNVAALNRRVRYGAALPTSGIARLLRNLAELPGVTIPLLIILPLLFLLALYQRQRQVSLLLSLDQPTFTPGLPGEGKVLMVTLDINTAGRVTVEVLDQYGHARATILRERRRTAGQHTLYWDGYDDIGRPVAPGEYTIQATAGTPPVKVTGAVQLTLLEDRFVHVQAGREQVREGASIRQAERSRRR